MDGGKRLEGRVEVQGSSSLGLFALSLSLITDGVLEIEGLPQNGESQRMRGFLEHIGMSWAQTQERVRVQGSPQESTIPYGLLRESETLLWPMIPLLLRCGAVRFAISPYDPTPAHVWSGLLTGLAKMGVSITQETGYLKLHSTRLKGADLRGVPAHPFRTSCWMLAALGADGQSLLSFPDEDPLLNEQIAMLQSMGAAIQREGKTLLVDGCGSSAQRPLKSTTLQLPADRLETGLLLLGTMITAGQITLTGRRVWGVDALINAISETEIDLQRPTPETLHLRTKKPFPAPDRVPPLDVPPILRDAWWIWLLLTRSQQSFSHDTQYPSAQIRSKLRQFGVSLTERDHTLHLGPKQRLHSAEISILHGFHELGLLLAALFIEGRSALQENAFTERLAAFPNKLKQLGAALSIDEYLAR